MFSGTPKRELEYEGKADPIPGHIQTPLEREHLAFRANHMEGSADKDKPEFERKQEIGRPAAREARAGSTEGAPRPFGAELNDIKALNACLRGNGFEVGGGFQVGDELDLVNRKGGTETEVVLEIP